MNNGADSNLDYGINLYQFKGADFTRSRERINTLANQTHKSGKTIKIPSGGNNTRDASIMQQTTFMNSNNNDL